MPVARPAAVVLAVTWSVMSSCPLVANVIIPTSKAECDAIKAQARAEQQALLTEADGLYAEIKRRRAQDPECMRGTCDGTIPRLDAEAMSIREEAYRKQSEGMSAWSRCMRSLARAKQLNEGLETLVTGKAVKAAKGRYLKNSNAALGASTIWDSPEIIGLLSGKSADRDTYGLLSKYGTALASKYIDFLTNNREAPGSGGNWLGSAVFSAAMAEIRQRHLETLAELERTAKEIAGFQGAPDTLSTATTPPLLGSPDPATQGPPDSEAAGDDSDAARERTELLEGLVAAKRDRDAETIRVRERRSTLDRLVAAKRERDTATLERRAQEARLAEQRRQQAAQQATHQRQAQQRRQTSPSGSKQVARCEDQVDLLNNPHLASQYKLPPDCCQIIYQQAEAYAEWLDNAYDNAGITDGDAIDQVETGEDREREKYRLYCRN